MTTAEFQAEFMQHAKMPEQVSPQQLIDDYVSTREHTLHQARDIGVGSDGLAEVAVKLASAFVRRWMMLRYAAIDLSFTKRDWWLTIEREGKAGARIVGASIAPSLNDDPVMKCVGRIPRFFSVQSGAKEFAFGEKLTTDSRNDRHTVGELMKALQKGVSYPDRIVSVSAKVPDGIGDKHQRLTREAIGHLTVARGLLYARGVDLRKEANISDYHNETTMTVSVIWAPLVEALSVTTEAPRPAGDPAVVFSVAGHAFLLDFYDTPDERQISDLVREFSEGRLPPRVN